MLTAFTKQQGHSVNCVVEVLFLCEERSLIAGASYMRFAINRHFLRGGVLKTRDYGCYLSTTVNIKARPSILFKRGNSKGQGVSH
jgi:hypothetical protein